MKISEFVREIQHIWRMLKCWQFKNEFNSLLISFQKVLCERAHSVTQFHCFQESKNHNIILIWAHMAQNPYFSTTSNMCLMGDIKAVGYFSWWHSTHLSICIIRILSYTLFESLHSDYKKVSPFICGLFPVELEILRAKGELKKKNVDCCRNLLRTKIYQNGYQRI